MVNLNDSKFEFKVPSFCHMVAEPEHLLPRLLSQISFHEQCRTLFYFPYTDSRCAWLLTPAWPADLNVYPLVRWQRASVGCIKMLGDKGKRLVSLTVYTDFVMAS
jgi:hypothetical protein